ncbi:hypothetical protein QYE76_051159 [Lolium multiflorum]|uniref:Transposase (putative) gypsy type domain-containing protein n=1 Tax=Lolium multiflorum TaxID=4521 RepID=A0AAD8SSV6_LOLMU|nr:hypothetical protein QYE76_051159 [Lolium multiflorum]
MAAEDGVGEIQDLQSRYEPVEETRVHEEGERLRFPKEESYPSPPIEYRVSVVDHLIRGLSPPIHEFLRGLLFVYGLQLHQLTPNSILHVSIFITLCECFLGVQPNWALWKRIFCLRRNGSHNVAYNIGGVVICIALTSNTSTSNSPTPSKGGGKDGSMCAKKAPAQWSIILLLSTEAPKFFAAVRRTLKPRKKRNWRQALMTRIHELQNTRGKELSGKTQQDYELESPEGDPLLDALSLLEIHGDEAREGLAEARTGLSRLFPYFFKKKEAPTTFTALAKCFNSQEDLGLQLRQEGLKVGVEGTIALVADSQQEVDWARVGNTEEMETKRFQDRAVQVRDFIDFFTRTLSLVYGTMFPRNKMQETLPALMEKFRDAPRIHGFVRAQLAAGARFAMIMIKICYPKLDMGQIVPKCLAKMAKRKRNFGKIDDIVTPVAEDMMDELLRMDAEFFVKGSYAEHSTRASNNERLTIDDILGSG